MLERDLPSPLTLPSMLCPDFNATVEPDHTQEGNLQLSSLQPGGAELCGISQCYFISCVPLGLH